ncbi:hypothetical protein [Actinopolyspora mzabensis]|nr:hypothetical protein [Actinopolyspora mzabensis]
MTRLVETGAAGFNIEHSEHTTDVLISTADQACRITELRRPQ